MALPGLHEVALHAVPGPVSRAPPRQELARHDAARVRRMLAEGFLFCMICVFFVDFLF